MGTLSYNFLMKTLLYSFSLIFLALSCAAPVKEAISKPVFDVNQNSIRPGTAVKASGKSLRLYKGSIGLGDNFIKKAKGTGLGFSFKNKVTIISVVPSIDTKVCEEQTHILGESKEISPEVDLVTISRDLPMAQIRFAKEAKLTNIRYYSDYKYGNFGKRTGLLIREKELLTRAIFVLDKNAVIRHIQVVSEITELPDMKKAISVSNSLLK